VAKAEAAQAEAEILQGCPGCAVLGRVRGLDALVRRHPLESWDSKASRRELVLPSH